MEQINVSEIKSLRTERKQIEKETFILKQDGVYALVEEEEELPFDKFTASLCADCSHLLEGICPKVVDGNNKRIEKYLYINFACEVISKKDVECRIIVLGCSKYNQDNPSNPYDAYAKRRDLALLYYGVDTLEEMYAIRKQNKDEQ